MPVAPKSDEILLHVMAWGETPALPLGYRGSSSFSRALETDKRIKTVGF